MLTQDPSTFTSYRVYRGTEPTANSDMSTGNIKNQVHRCQSHGPRSWARSMMTGPEVIDEYCADSNELSKLRPRKIFEEHYSKLAVAPEEQPMPYMYILGNLTHARHLTNREQCHSCHKDQLRNH